MAQTIPSSSCDDFLLKIDGPRSVAPIHGSIFLKELDLVFIVELHENTSLFLLHEVKQRSPDAQLQH